MSNHSNNQYLPDIVSHPGETLLEILEDRGMSQAELAERSGRPKKTINEIIKGKAAITPETAIQFERVLGTPASFWNNREINYRDWLARQEERKELKEHIPWMKKFPIRGMINRGWIENRSDPINQLEELLNYFGVASPVQWQDMILRTQLRQSPTFAADPAAVSVWLRQGEIQSEKIYCFPFDKERFNDSLLKLRSLTKRPPEEFFRHIIELCAQAGVAVVFVPEIRGTRTYGATRWLSSTKALIMLSLRYKTDDHLWFTFFHEAGHILLHGKRDVFLEYDDQKSDDTLKMEKEADIFAADILIPPDEIKQFSSHGAYISHGDIIKFAQHLDIAPGILVGRLQHDRVIPVSHFNDLKQRLNQIVEEDNKVNN